MCSDVAISVKNLTKTYRIFGHPGDRIKQALTFGQVRFHREFTALKDVSFDIKKGETVGIIGRNGSGKSTLLQLICGILKPTSGAVEVRGRISALLELGAGFNPEFTGRENVYFQGVVMGLTKSKIDERFDEITTFADIGEFIDQPVRTYSSGMFVRLAFSAAINLDPEILVVDEALAVGDMAFQSRCMDKFRELQKNGLTIILVTHAHSIVADLCHRVVYLRKGLLVHHGLPDQVLTAYEEEAVQSDRQVVGARTSGNLGIQIMSVEVLDDDQRRCSHFRMYEPVVVQLILTSEADVSRLCIGMEVRSSDGFVLWNATSVELEVPLPHLTQGQSTDIRWSFKAAMAPGTYVVAIGAGEIVEGHYRRHDRLHHAAEITVQDSVGIHGYLPLQPVIQVADSIS